MGDQPRLDQTGLRRLGLFLILVGLGYFLSIQTENRWMPFFVLILFLAIQSGMAFAQKNTLDFFFCIFGFSASAGCLVLINPVIGSLLFRSGATIFVFGIGFILVYVFQYFNRQKAGWWAFFIGLTFCLLAIPFLEAEISVLSVTLWVCLGAGGGMVMWGLAKRLLGLIIAGSLVSSMGFGVYAAWNQVVSPNGLTETGIMLVWFGLGWGSITILSRLRLTRTLGWPLIPAGILGVVGWGLYSGGDPNNALSFIGNTGSLGVLIFGLYFLLMKRGIRR